MKLHCPDCEKIQEVEVYNDKCNPRLYVCVECGQICEDDGREIDIDDTTDTGIKLCEDCKLCIMSCFSPMVQNSTHCPKCQYGKDAINGAHTYCTVWEQTMVNGVVCQHFLKRPKRRRANWIFFHSRLKRYFIHDSPLTEEEAEDLIANKQQEWRIVGPVEESWVEEER